MQNLNFALIGEDTKFKSRAPSDFWKCSIISQEILVSFPSYSFPKSDVEPLS